MSVDADNATTSALPKQSGSRRPRDEADDQRISEADHNESLLAVSTSTSAASSGSGGSTLATLESKRNDLEAERKELKDKRAKREARIDKLEEQLDKSEGKDEKLAIRQQIVAFSNNIHDIHQEIITIDKRIISLNEKLPPFDPNAPRRFDKGALQTASQQLGLRDDQGTERKIEGRSGFFEEVHGQISLLLHPRPPTSNQNSRTFVLDGASGIGKTFGSLAFGPQFPSTTNDRNYDIFTAYVGFNCSAALSSFEIDHIKRTANTKDLAEIEKCMRHVLFTRLWLHLAFDWEGNGGAATQFASKTLTMRPNFTYELTEEDMTSFIVEQAPRLRGLSATPSADSSTSERRLVLMVVVDEGQELDDLCPAAPNDPRTSGARTALRVLRQLQMSLWQSSRRRNVNGPVLLLPLMTGLNPHTVTNNEYGQNAILGTRPTSAMMDFDVYEKFVLELPYEGKLQLSDEHRRRIAPLLYPRVRGVVDGGRKLQDLRVPESMLGSLPPADVDMLIHAALKQEPKMADRVPVDVIKKPGSSKKTRYVYIDAVTWNVFAERDMLAIELPFELGCAAVNIVCDVDNCSFYEFAAFKTITFLFQLLLHPALVDTRKELSDQCRGWLPDGFASLAEPATSENLESASHAVTLRTVKKNAVTLWAFKLSDPKKAYHPFTRAKSHEEAFEEAKLSEEFARALQVSSYVEKPLFVLCGAEAPFDLLLLYRPTPTTQPKRVRLWMCDAKHVTDTKKALPVAQPAKIQEMEETAKQLHNALKRALKAKHNFDLDDEFQWHIVSNSTNINFDSSRHRVINPDNFVLEPWTSVLFGTTSSFFDRDMQ